MGVPPTLAGGSVGPGQGGYHYYRHGEQAHRRAGRTSATIALEPGENPPQVPMQFGTRGGVEHMREAGAITSGEERLQESGETRIARIGLCARHRGKTLAGDRMDHIGRWR